MKRKYLASIVLLSLLILFFLSSCKGFDGKYIKPKILNPYPQNDMTNIELTDPITFSIDAYGQQIEKIYIYISNSNSFLDSQREEIKLNTYLPPGGWESNQKYYWKLRMIQPGHETLTDVYRFSTINQPQYGLELLTPLPDQQEVDLEETLKWSFQQSPKRNAVVFLVYLSKDKPDPEKMTPIITKEESYLPVGGYHPNSTYYWLIKAVNEWDHDEIYATSEIRGFQTKALSPGYPEIELLSPEDGQTNVDVKEKLSWQATPSSMEHVLEYKIYLAHTLNDLEKADPILTDESEYFPTDGWKKGSVYYWKVIACEEGNCTSAGPNQFQTVPKDQMEPEIKLFLPENDSTEVNGQTPLVFAATPSTFNTSELFFRIYISNTLEGLNKFAPIVSEKEHYLPATGWKSGQNYFWKVTAVQGDYDASAGPWEFTVKANKPDTPQIGLLSPTFKADNVSVNTPLMWEATPSTNEALLYQVYLSNSKEELPNVEPVVTDKKVYLPTTGWSKSKEYYWKVRVVQGDTHSESAIWQFKTVEKSSDDPSIELLYPENDQRSFPNSDYLRWKGKAGIAGDTLQYNLYIAYSPSQIDHVAPIKTEKERFKPSGDWEYGQDYYWKCEVIELDKSDSSDVWHFRTEEKPFNVPGITLLSPLNGEHQVGREEALQWQGEPATTGDMLNYKVYIASSLEELNHVTPVETDSEEFIPSGGWEYSKTYYWKCQVFEGEQSNISEIRTFTVKDKDAQDPDIQLNDPEDNALQVDINQALTWKGIPATVGDSLNYKLYVAKTRDDLDDVIPIHTDEESYSPVGGWEYDQGYFWKCEVFEGERSNVSQVRQFKTQDKPEDVPDIGLLQPADQEVEVDIVQPLSWCATPVSASDSLSYKLFIAHTLEELDTVIPVETDNQSYLPVSGWDSASRYFWKCVVLESSKTNVSPIWSFLTKEDAPKKPEIALIYPEDKSQNIPVTTPLSWEATATESGETLKYELYLGEDPQALTEKITLSQKNYLPNENWKPLTDYYWKVKVIQGERFAESDVRSFKTGKYLDFQIAIDSPASGTLDVDVRVPLSWEATENSQTVATPTYFVYLANTLEDLNHVTPYETKDKTFHPPDGRWEYDKRYYWKLEGYDGTDRDFAGPAWFQTRNREYIPPSVKLLQPQNGEIWVDPNTTLKWEGIEGHIRSSLEYEVYYSETEEALYTSEPATVLTNIEQYKPTEPWALNTHYYWRIKVLQSELFSDATATFETRGPIYENPQIELLTPENGATEVALDTSLTWEATQSQKRSSDFYHSRGASLTYKVYVADNTANLTQEDALYYAEIQDADVKEFVPGTAWESNTSYVWKVEACSVVDDTPVASRTAGAFSFTTRGLRPAAPSDDGLIPSDGQVDSSIYTQLDWGVNLTSETTTPTYFEIYLDTNGILDTMVGTSAYTMYQPTKLSTGTDYYWKVISVNKQGRSEGPQWRFKTRNDTLSKTTDLFVKDGYCFAAEQENGVSVYEIPDDPASPLIQKANVSFQDRVNGVTYQGNQMFVSIGNGGVVLVNISDPQNPVVGETINDNGYCIASYSYQDYLYIANGFNGTIVDVSNINDPQQIGFIDPTNDASGSAIDLVVSQRGSRLITAMADGAMGLTIVDVNDSENPTVLSTDCIAYDEDVNVVGIDEQGGYLYLVSLTKSEESTDEDDSGNGLTIVQITDPENPQIKAQINTPGFSKDVCVSGDYAYIADGKNGLVIIHIQDPESPTDVYSSNTMGITANAVFVEGDTVYVAADENGTKVVDVTDKANPKIIH